MRNYSDTIKTTMFDFAPFYHSIALEMPDNCRVIECGVADGKSAIYLAERLADAGKQFKLIMVDNMDYGGYDQFNTIWRHVHNSGLADFIEIIPKDSVAASEHINDQAVDFLFLDTSHTEEETKDSIIAWLPKMKHGSVMAGHDYYLYPPVKKAVDELIPSRTLLRTEKDYGIWILPIYPETQISNEQLK